MDDLPKTSAELRARLNDIAGDEAWKFLWTNRGYPVGEVRACIRKMIGCAIERENANDPRGFTAWCKHILNYAQGRLLDETLGDAYEGPIGPGMVFKSHADDPESYSEPPHHGDPEEEDQDGQKWWLELCDRNPDKTFKQLVWIFKDRYDYWPNQHWPGMPVYPIDKNRKAGKVPRERLVPSPIQRGAHGEETDQERTRQAGAPARHGTEEAEGP